MSSSTWAASPFARHNLPNHAHRYIRNAASKSSFEELFDLPRLTVPLTGVCTPLLALSNLGIAPICVSERAILDSSPLTAGTFWYSCSSSRLSPTRLMWSVMSSSNKRAPEFSAEVEKFFPPKLFDEVARGLRDPASTHCMSR